MTQEKTAEQKIEFVETGLVELDIKVPGLTPENAEPILRDLRRTLENCGRLSLLDTFTVVSNVEYMENPNGGGGSRNMSYDDEVIPETPEEIAEYEAMYKRVRNKEKEMKDNRKPLSERLPKYVFERIHQDIGQASMCWENIDEAGVFDTKKAADIAFELCHFIADILDSKQEAK